MKRSDGIVCIDKPAGPSSFAMVSLVRKRLSIRKAGHAGTLDPRASGLLVIALGNATKFLSYLPLEPKTYEFSVQFGSQTDTLDSEGAIIKSGGPIPGEHAVRASLKSFIGSISQVPPEYSSIKINGERAYKRAREGMAVIPKARTISVFSLELVSFDAASGVAHLRAVCSGGTYVRSLARDIACFLGTYGYASAVRRTGAGIFSVDKAISVEAMAGLAAHIEPVENVVPGGSLLYISDDQREACLLGKDIFIPGAIGSGMVPETGTAFAVDHEKRLVAALRQKSPGWFHPERVAQS